MELSTCIMFHLLLQSYSISTEDAALPLIDTGNLMHVSYFSFYFPTLIEVLIQGLRLFHFPCLTVHFFVLHSLIFAIETCLSIQ